MNNTNGSHDENPYRSPAGVDEEHDPAARSRRRAGDLALVGLFVGTVYGGATGAAITVSLDVSYWMVLIVQGLKPPSEFGQPDTLITLYVITHYVAVAAFGALLGAFSGAGLGLLQGLLTAWNRTGSRPRLVGFAAFCWAGAGAMGCALIDQGMLSAAEASGMRYVALLLAPAAAGIGGAAVASKLVRAAGIRGAA